MTTTRRPLRRQSGRRAAAAARSVAAAAAAALAACSGESRPSGAPATPTAGAPTAGGAAGGAAGGGAPGTTGSAGAATASAAVAPIASDPAARGDACPRDGRWRACSVAERLDQAGLVPRVDSEQPAPRVPFLAIPGTRFLLGRGALDVFVYEDSTRLARDVAKLDTVRVAPRGGEYAWEVPPTFVRSANMLAVLLTQNEHQIERVRLALEAGPPQRNPEPTLDPVTVSGRRQ